MRGNAHKLGTLTNGNIVDEPGASDACGDKEAGVAVGRGQRCYRVCVAKFRIVDLVEPSRQYRGLQIGQDLGGILAPRETGARSRRAVAPFSPVAMTH